MFKKCTTERRLSVHTTSNKRSAFFETGRQEIDETEEPIYVFDETHHGRWAREEAVVDSGAAPESGGTHERVQEETQSRRRAVNWWWTDLGIATQGVFDVGPVSRTLISTDRLQETGHGVALTQSQQRILNMRTGKIMPLREKGMFMLETWIL